MNQEKRFLALYEKYKTPVYFYAVSMLKDKGLAEDVMQETFIRVRAHAHECRTYHNVKTWILRITHNLALNCIRDRAVETCFEDLDAVSEEFGQKTVDESDYIDFVLGQLSEEERLVFSLHHLYKYKYREIAEIRQLPIGTVQTHCRSAREKLKQILASEHRETAKEDLA